MPQDWCCIKLEVAYNNWVLFYPTKYLCSSHWALLSVSFYCHTDYTNIIHMYVCMYINIDVFKGHNCKSDLQQEIMLFDVSWLVCVRFLVPMPKGQCKVNMMGTA